MRTFVFVLILASSTYALSSQKSLETRTIGFRVERYLLELQAISGDAPKLRTDEQLEKWRQAVEKLLPQLTSDGVFEEVNEAFTHVISAEIELIIRTQVFPPLAAHNLKFTLAYLEKHGTLVHYEALSRAATQMQFIRNQEFERDIPSLFMSTLKAVSSRLHTLERVDMYIKGKKNEDLRASVSDRKPGSCMILKFGKR